MKKILYLALAAGVLFDVAAGTYLLQLLGERNNLSVDARPERSMAAQSTRQKRSQSSMASRPAYHRY